MTHHPGEVCLAAVPAILRIGSGCRHFLQIVTGAEYRAIRRQHDDAHRGIVTRICQYGGKRIHHPLGQGIARFRVIQCQPQNAVIIAFTQNQLIGAQLHRPITITHRASPLAYPAVY